MSDLKSKRCTVVYATRERQYLWTLELPLDATIADAVERARMAATAISDIARDESPGAGIPWDNASVGIFGELRQRSDQPVDGDRIELYRPLKLDPRDQRRRRLGAK